MVSSASRGSRLDLDALASGWQRALDAAHRALDAARSELPEGELASRARTLVGERQAIAESLGRLAETASVHPPPWLSPVPMRAEMIGLTDDVRACVFDLEGVLTDGAALHAWAWGETFDGFLARLADRSGRVAMPFDRESDYRSFVDGRPRIEGVRTFLRSRGIRLPLGEPDDPSGMNTVHALARRKSEVLVRRLEREGVVALAGARRYLECVGHLGLDRAVLSASVRTAEMIERAGLTSLVEATVDADRMVLEQLRSRPEPDMLLSVCSRFDVEPGAVVTFTSTPVGVTAGRAAGVRTIGVGDGEDGESLALAGADRVVGSMIALLDARLVAGL